ncbi:MAG: extradiol ring-cleavage dioxygenase [Acidimicrobiales bacterium]|jgi:hypothetical protein
MGDLLFVGVTHYPPLNLPDSEMAGLLRFALDDPSIPAQHKDPSSWPESMRDEWANYDASAARHRDQLVDNFRHVRQAIDEFAPDVVLVWGDDQYENFQEDVVPPFCVLCYPDTVTHPWQKKRAFGARPLDEAEAIVNVWDEGPDHGIKVKGAPAIGRYLTKELLGRGIDVSYAYKPLHYDGLAHAFLNTVMFLDYDRSGFPYPVLPVSVNCYGSRVIANHGGPIHFGQEVGGPEALDPPAPSPKRCFAMGAASAAALADSPWRCVVVASSSWSHAFLTDVNWRLRPDTDSDLHLYRALQERRFEAFADATPDALDAAGQQEVLNWCALAGALHETDATIEYLTFVESFIFNSNKCFFIGHPGGAK